MIFTDSWKLSLNKEMLNRIIGENSKEVRKLILTQGCELNDHRDK